ncbi:ANTAR domain-containing protein [Streptomyces sp. NPDC093060]|uniref:ANTAR domain-containing protein n=1 Tax=Streptomyces sp. NPDC093060 TaxID=3366019 RepID=UPI00381E826E
MAGAAPQDLLIDVSPHGGRVRVTIRGEIDISVKAALEAALQDAVRRSTYGVDLDLKGTVFCDCSGLSCFLAARHRALAAGKTVTIQAASPLVQRLLGVTDTWPLFTLQHRVSSQPACTPDLPAAVSVQDAPVGDGDLRAELVQLRRAVQTRPVIDQAIGILTARYGLGAEDAWQVLVAVSQNTDSELAVVAGELVTAVRGQPMSDAVQQEVGRAVATLRTGHAGSDGMPRRHSVQEDGEGSQAATSPDEA